MVVDLRLVFLLGVLTVFLPASRACPTTCICVKGHVRCSGNQLQTVPEGIPADTMSLDLQNNQITKVDRNRIQHLSKLQELALGNNYIKQIEVGTFSELSNLTKLNLDSNMLTSIPPGVFDGLWNLTSLYITKNKLVSIEGAFRNLTKLGHMDLGGNKISELGDKVFQDMKNLRHLTLSDNKIGKVSLNAFPPLESLSSLVLKNNPIRNGNKLFLKNHRLSYIDLTACSFKTVPSGLPWATQHLQLRSNNITKITKDAFIGLRNLVILLLDENQITVIEKGAFSRSRKLEHIWLNGNQLKKIPSPFSSKVKKLYMSKNRVSKISAKNFPKNSALTTLSLNGNNILTIDPNAFKEVKFLKELYLNGNKLYSIRKNTFTGLGELETLSLNNNKLTRIEEGAFNGLASLNDLSMAFIVDIKTNVLGNMFVEMPSLSNLDLQLSSSIASQVLVSDEMMSSLANITSINLMNNELTTLNPNLQMYWSKVKVIKIAGNRWHCDKRLQWLSAWLKSHRKLFFQRQSIQCATPSSLYGLPLSLLKPFQFAPVTSTQAPPTTTTVMTKKTKQKVKKDKKNKKKTKRKPNKSIIKPSPQPTRPYPPTQIMLTKTKMVTRVQTFFVFKSTTPTPQTKKTLKNTRKPRRKPRTTATTSEASTASSSAGPNTRPTKLPRRRDTAIPTINDEPKPTNSSTKAPSLDKTSLGTWVTNSSDDLEHAERASRTSSSSVDMKTVIIATCVTGLVLLIILGVVIFFVIRYRQNKLVYHRALQYRQDYSDVVFFVGEPMHDFVDPKPKAVRSRSDRGSTSSRPSEDITNDLNTSMKVFTWDDE